MDDIVCNDLKLLLVLVSFDHTSVYSTSLVHAEVTRLIRYALHQIVDSCERLGVFLWRFPAHEGLWDTFSSPIPTTSELLSLTFVSSMDSRCPLEGSLYSRRRSEAQDFALQHTSSQWHGHSHSSVCVRLRSLDSLSESLWSSAALRL